MAERRIFKGQVLGLRSDFVRDSDGTHFSGYPKIEHRDYGLVSMQDHAGNSDNTVECFIGFEFGDEPLRVLPGGELRLVHRGSFVRYDPTATGRDRFRHQDNGLTVDVVDLGQELDIADGSGDKPGAIIAATLAWPRGVRGSIFKTETEGFVVESDALAFRLRSRLQLNSDPEWIERESWMHAFELDGIEFEADVEPIVADTSDSEADTVAFLADLAADPELMELFVLIKANPSLIDFFKQIAAQQP